MIELRLVSEIVFVINFHVYGGGGVSLSTKDSIFVQFYRAQLRAFRNDWCLQMRRCTQLSAFVFVFVCLLLAWQC